jgi:prevent-host-death family protein
MNARTEFQVIVGANGKPAFVVVPYADFRKMKARETLIKSQPVLM